MTSLQKRISLDILLFLVVAHGWWFIAVPLVMVGLYFWPLYLEAFIAGVMYDALFGMNDEAGLVGYAGISLSIIWIAAAYVFKKIIRK